MSAEFILGVIAAVIFLVVVAHVVALRRYASLFEAPAETRAHDGSGQVSGRIGGRDAAFSLSLPRRRPKQSGALRISVACAGPLDLVAARASHATAFQTALGLTKDRATGDAELDRRFVFTFDDGTKLRACLERTDLKRHLLDLADLGAETIRIEHDRLTASISLPFVLPPRLGQVRDVLERVIVAARDLESDGPAVRVPDRRDPSALSTAPRQGVALDLPIAVALFLAAVALAFGIAEPLWARASGTTWEHQLGRMEARLGFAIVVAAILGCAAARLAGGRPWAWGLILSLPMLVYTIMICAQYFVFTLAGAAVARGILAETGPIVTRVLTLLTVAPLLLLSSGWAGARVGRRVSPA